MSAGLWRSIAPDPRDAPSPEQRKPARSCISVACLHCRLKKAKVREYNSMSNRQPNFPVRRSPALMYKM